MLSVMIEAFNNNLETLIVPMAALVSLCVTVRVDFPKEDTVCGPLLC